MAENNDHGLSEEDMADNLQKISNPLRALKASLDGGNALDEVKAALSAFVDVHEECMAGEVPDPEPWQGYTGVGFGLGDDFDIKVDYIYGVGVSVITANNVALARTSVLRRLNDLIPMIDAREAGPADEDVEMNGGRKRRRGKKTKKGGKKTKKTKKSRRYTRRR
jgi:hypothetical protein